MNNLKLKQFYNMTMLQYNPWQLGGQPSLEDLRILFAKHNVPQISREVLERIFRKMSENQN